MYQVLCAIQYAGIIILACELIYLFSHKVSRIQQDLAMLCALLLIIFFAYTLEMQCRDFSSAMTAKKLRYLAIPFVTLSMLFLLMNYCRVKRPGWLFPVLFLVQSFETLVVFTAEKHLLYYTSISFTNEGLFPHLVLERNGILYFFYKVLESAYTLGMVAIIFLSFKKQCSAKEKKQLCLFLLIILFPYILFLVFGIGITDEYDSTLIGYLFSAIGFWISFHTFHLLDAVTLAREQAVDYLKCGLLVYDNEEKKVFTNSIADSLIAQAGEGAVRQTQEPLTLGETVYESESMEIAQDGVTYGQMVIVRDATQTYRYEEQLKAEKEKAIAADSAKSEFLACMSHELRTPMNAVCGMTEVLLRDERSEKDTRYLKNILSAGKSLLQLINDLLDFSKLEAGKFTITEGDYRPEEMLEELEPIFTQRIGDKPLILQTVIDPNLPVALKGDDVRIRQVLINLVGNAIKYTDAGSVCLSLTVVQKTAARALIKFSVKDTGMGIRPEDIHVLFDAFSQVDIQKNRKKEGTGLGLSICHQLVELMGGELKVESVYGKGSEFFFEIEQKVISQTTVGEAKKNAVQSPSADSAAEAERLSGTILLVDDTDINRMVAKALLEPYQLTIDEAENGAEAVRMVKEKHYDLVLMDHLMPVMDGIAATKAIRSMDGDYYKKLPIIALSASDSKESKADFILAGMNESASKPIVTQELVTKMRRLMYKN